MSKVCDEELEEALRNESSDNDISVFVLPGGNLAVPLCGTNKSELMSEFIHVRDLKCSLDICTKKVKSKKHTLIVKQVPVCRHSLIGEYNMFYFFMVATRSAKTEE